MKLFRSILVSASLLVTVGCATTYNPDIDYNPEYNFSEINTYHVVDGFQAQQQETQALNRNLSSLDNDRIVRAIESNLDLKGMASNPADTADVLVRFQLVTQDRTKLTTYNTGIYNCWRCRGVYSYPYPVQQVEIKNYTEGTLIIDMVDPQSKKSVWRSVVSKAVKKSISVEEKQAKVQELVNAMLATFKQPIVVEE